jgi:protein involved in polysaccharide export with SLBB domain
MFDRKIFLLVAFLFSAILSAQNLSTVKVDSMSDSEIMAILKAGEGKGLDVTQGEQLALSMGLPAEEAAKFKKRADQLQKQKTDTGANKVVGTATPTSTMGNTTAVETTVLEKAEEKSATATALSGIVEGEVNPIKEKSVQIYGQQFFRESELKIFERSLDARASDSYVIGVGDEIGVSAYGTSYFSEIFKVDERGTISMRNVGNIYARGMTYGDLKQQIKGKLSNFMPLSSNTISFTLAYSRTISVNIVGEVVKPGSYKIPAVNTAFNALMAAGGPSDLGTLREIKVIRDGKVMRTLDVYAFLSNPTAANDYYLQENDYLSVGVIGNVVPILGAVKRPMLYEIKKSESIGDLLALAGGFTETANTQFVQVQRQVGDESQLFEVMDYKQLVQPGDEVLVQARNTELRKSVTVTGEVNLPGAYRFEEGMRVLDLIQRGGGLRNDSIVAIDRAWLVRTNSDYTMDYLEVDVFAVLANPMVPANFLLKAKDSLTVTAKKDFTEEEYVSIGGAVRKSVKTKFAKGMRVSSLLQMANGITFETFTGKGVLRRTKQDLSLEFINLDLAAILNEPGGDKDLFLQARDSLSILVKPHYDASLVVAINGAVRNPITLPYAEGMTLGDLLRISGGLLPNADFKRVEVSRLNAFSEFQKGSIREVRTVVLTTEVPAGLVRDLSATAPSMDFVLQPYDQVVVREIPDYKAQEFVYIGGEVTYPGFYPIMSRQEKLNSFVNRAGGITRFADEANAQIIRPNTPNMVLNLAKALKWPSSPVNYILEPGDTVQIPKTSSLVTVYGTGHNYFTSTGELVLNVPFTPGRSAEFYIKKYALGFSDKADRSNIYVVYPSGKVDRTANFWLYNDYPIVKAKGVIRVELEPEKAKRDKREQKPFDLNQAIATVTTALTGFATLYVLLTR